MLLYFYLKSRKNTESKNSKVPNKESGRKMLLPKCAVPESKKANFFKEQEASGLISSLGIKAPLIKIPLVGPLLF